jgi:hypothetical protein
VLVGIVFLVHRVHGMVIVGGGSCRSNKLNLHGYHSHTFTIIQNSTRRTHTFR